MNSTVTLTFNSVFSVDEFIYLEIENKATSGVVLLSTETWKASRTQSKQIPTSSSINDDADNYATYFDIDYNTINQFSISVNANEVTITSNYKWYEFIDYDTDGDVTIAISGTADFSDFEITDSSVSAASEQCDYITISLETNNNIKNYVLDNVETILNDTELEVDYPRGQDFSIILRDDDDNEIYYPARTDVSPFPDDIIVVTEKYDKLLESNVTVNVSITISGSTVQINVSNTENLELEYSLDGVIFQEENIFTGQPDGDYTVYIQDQFLCQVTKDFTIDEQGTREPIFLISDASSIPFVKIEDIDNCSTFKTDKNSFASDEEVMIKYCPNILYNSCDNTKIQIKTNYSNITVTRRDEDSNEEEITITKQTQNLSRYEKLDCTYYSYPDGRLGVFFTSGNVYNEVGDVIDTHSLEGYLPDFGVIGNLVEIDGIGTLEIVSILFDAEISKNVLIFDQEYSDVSVVSTAASIYDLLSYEIYEFECDFSEFLIGLNDIHINAITADGTEDDFLSPNIEISENHENTLAIRYYNNNDRDIFYKFGLENFIRVTFIDQENGFKDEFENNVTDEETVVVTSFLNRKKKFYFNDLSSKRYTTLYIALSSENLFINDEGYSKDETFVTKREENTNIYHLEANLLLSGETYSNKESGYTGSDEISEIDYSGPLLTDSDTNFIKITK